MSQASSNRAQWKHRRHTSRSHRMQDQEQEGRTVYNTTNETHESCTTKQHKQKVHQAQPGLANRSCIYNHSSPSRQLTTWTAVYGHSSFVFYYVQDVARWRIGTTSGSDTLTTGTTVPCTTPAPCATPVPKFALHQPKISCATPVPCTPPTMVWTTPGDSRWRWRRERQGQWRRRRRRAAASTSGNLAMPAQGTQRITGAQHTVDNRRTRMHLGLP